MISKWTPAFLLFVNFIVEQQITTVSFFHMKQEIKKTQFSLNTLKSTQKYRLCHAEDLLKLTNPIAQRRVGISNFSHVMQSLNLIACKRFAVQTPCGHWKSWSYEISSTALLKVSDVVWNWGIFNSNTLSYCVIEVIHVFLFCNPFKPPQTTTTKKYMKAFFKKVTEIIHGFFTMCLIQTIVKCCAIWYEALKYGIWMIGQNDVLTR